MLNVLGVLGVLDVLNVLNVLNMLKVLHVLYVLDMLMDASLACWALFGYGSTVIDATVTDQQANGQSNGATDL